MAYSADITLGDRGRLVLPSPVRSALGLESGSRLRLSIEADGAVRLTPYRSIAEGNRGRFADRRGAGSAVDDLIDERRAAAAREA